MNSISNLEAVDNIINSTGKVIKKEPISDFQVAYEVNKSDVHQILTSLKLEGWKQLSYLSAVDWPEENKFELVYILLNWDKPVYIQIRAKIDRENPSMNSIIPIFPGAKYYEREAHEFFGIAFPGNPDYKKQLIMEQWDDIPPLRKDFDPRAYSDRKYPSREYPDNFSKKDKENESLEKQAKRRKRARKLRTGGEE
ncbi:MAG: NADH-quinone oxidoreductase subunit C [Candidatus Izimaplasma sp.]|nr:NADH-quinone oxidoreductase subunit C [Candidatus Izimaplasma bacterium]